MNDKQSDKVLMASAIHANPFSVKLTVVHPADDKKSFEMVSAIVDTGATLSVLPKRLLEDIGITARRTVEMLTAAGETIKRKVGSAILRTGDHEATVDVVFGEENDLTLLGNNALVGMAVKVDPAKQQLVAALHTLAAKNTENPMDHKTLLIGLLKLNANATDAEIEAAVKAANLGDVKVFAGAVEVALKPLTDKIAALEARDDQREREVILAAALAEGKVVPDEASKLPMADFKALVGKLPVTVPVGRRTPEHVKALASTLGATGLSAEVQKNLGISDEAWKKHAQN